MEKFLANQENKAEKDIAAEYPSVISFLREDLQDLRSELREITNKIDELTDTIFELRKDMNKMLVWIVGTMVAIGGIIIAVIKL